MNELILTFAIIALAGLLIGFVFEFKGKFNKIGAFMFFGGCGMDFILLLYKYLQL